MNKPIVFNYRDYTELREAYKQLLADNQKLMADNAKLRQEKTNLEIRLRIAEADRPTVAYICDGRACSTDCSTTDCELTRDIEHAQNFVKIAENCYCEKTDEADREAK